MNNSIEKAEKNLLHVYNRFPVVFDHGNGMNLYDANGKEYLDFASGIGVMAFGYGDEEYTATLKEQVEKLTHTSNLYYHAPMIDAAEKLCIVSGMDKVFFTNSGAEAVEGAIKTAKKYAYLRDGFAGHEIIAMEHSFHGRTVGALSVTGTEHYREPFLPLMDGVRFANFNDLESVKAQITDKTCAIIMETIQGEGGLLPATPEFIKGVRALCDEKDILLILDEIQCGMGRSGAMFAWQRYGVKPDIMTCAKALGAGVPVGAFVLNGKVAQNSLVPGDHGTTYGGNPFVCAAVAKSIDIMTKRNLPGDVARREVEFVEILDEIVAKYYCVEARRGMGFMQGLVLTVPVSDVVKACLDAGLVVLSAGGNVLRLLPPLIATRAHMERMAEILGGVLDEF